MKGVLAKLAELSPTPMHVYEVPYSLYREYVEELTHEDIDPNNLRLIYYRGVLVIPI